VWGNEGDEFQSEEVVKKYLKMFQRSALQSLGPMKLRQLMRIAKFQTFKRHHTLFTEDDPQAAIYVLYEGAVAMQTETAKKQGKDVVETVRVEKPAMGITDHSPVRIIDMCSTDYHKLSGTVASDEAQIFVFPTEKVLEQLGVESCGQLIRSALSNAILKIIPLFKLSFSEVELGNIAEVLDYNLYNDNHVFITQGARMSNIVLIQRGKLKIKEDRKKDVVIWVGGDPPDKLPTDEYWQPVYVLGVRNLLYDCPSPVGIECSPGHNCEAWTMELPKADMVMIETSALNHLQLGTSIMVLVKVILFKKLKIQDPRLRKLMMNCEMKELWATEPIFEQGDEGDAFFVLMEGSVEIEANGKVVAKQTADIDHGKVHYFGELAILEGKGGRRAATVRVTSPAAVVIVVSIAAIESAFGKLEDLLKEQGLSGDKIIQDAMSAHSKKSKKRRP